MSDNNDSLSPAAQAALDAVFSAPMHGRHRGSVPPIESLTDQQAREQWSRAVRTCANADADLAPKSWLTALHDRLSKSIAADPSPSRRIYLADQLRREWATICAHV